MWVVQPDGQPRAAGAGWLAIAVMVLCQGCFAARGANFDRYNIGQIELLPYLITWLITVRKQASR